MCLNFWALYSTQNPQLGQGIYIFVPIFSDHHYSSFFPEDGTVIFKITVLSVVSVLQHKTGQASCVGIPLPLTFLAVVLNRQIASQSWARVSKESAICCHLAGLQPVTLACKGSISDQHVAFAFTATIAQMKDD